MDYHDELKAILSHREDKRIVELSKKVNLVDNRKECEKRHEQIDVNKSFMKETMKDWSATVSELKVNGPLSIKYESEELKYRDSQTELPNTCIYGLPETIVRAITSAKSMQSTVDGVGANDEEYKKLREARLERLRHEKEMEEGRRKRKIKSKGYHRHVRKRAIKDYLTKSSTMGEEELVKVAEGLDRLRAEERMTQRHKQGGKFAKLQKLRNHDPQAREALQAMHDKAQELRRRNQDSDNYNDEDEEIEELGNAENDDDDDDVEFVSNAKMPKSSMAPSLTALGTESSITDGNETKSSRLISIRQTLAYDDDDAEQSSLTVDGDVRERFKETLHQIYMEDNNIQEEFEKDKQALVDQEAPKDIQTFIPGWGSWTGPSYEEQDVRRKKAGLIKAPSTNRRDKNRSRVYIKSGIHDALKKHYVKDIPFPFNTAEQYNLSRSQLVSSVFNSETKFRNLIKPKYKNRMGQHIYPLRKEDKVNK